MTNGQLYSPLNNVTHTMLLPLLPRPIGFPVPDLKFNHSNLVLEGAYLFLSVALIYFSFPIILLDMSFILSSLNISLGKCFNWLCSLWGGDTVPPFPCRAARLEGKSTLSFIHSSRIYSPNKYALDLCKSARLKEITGVLIS